MKTLFALLTGVALGTGVALWLAARRLGQDEPTLEAPGTTAVPPPAPPAPATPATPATEEASA